MVNLNCSRVEDYVSAYFYEPPLWAALSTLAYVNTLLAILAVLRYSRHQRSLDIFILSFLGALFLNISVLICIQIDLDLRSKWNKSLCFVYVFSWNALRLVQLLSLFALALDRLLIFRSPSYSFQGSRRQLFFHINSNFLAIFHVF